MKKIFLSMIFMLAPLAAAFAQDVIGKWKLEDGSAIVEVYQAGDVFNGKIVWLAEPTEADGSPAVDNNNPDKALRSRQLRNCAPPSQQRTASRALVHLPIHPGHGRTDGSRETAPPDR